MATGTFTYSALRTKTLKEHIKSQRKIVSLSNSARASNAVSIGTNAAKTISFYISSGLSLVRKVL